MKKNGNEFDNFWEFVKRTKKWEVSIPTQHSLRITYNPDISKVEFVNEKINQGGVLIYDDFKRLWGKQADILLPYIRGEKIPSHPTNEFYIACIIRDYNKWIA